MTRSAPAPRLIAIVDSERAPFDAWLGWLEPVLALAPPASIAVMLRDRQRTARERLAMGTALRQLTAAHAQLLSVGDRLDLAQLLGADAVHLPESGVTAIDARAYGARYGRHWWVSRASHDPMDAATADADAVVLSPIVEPRKGRPALGIAGVQQARSALLARSPARGECRLYALGGVTAAETPALLAAGADGVAVIGALLEPAAASDFASVLAQPRGAPAPAH